ncbi:amidohydrolase [Thalassotalea litorea]|uniref:Amidohydrolase n=1 Tax=Thalassotalea litorea TaxID=2020715 RepID=A0A5R9ITV0_9GAMM|nr:amidohydrolase [Thalassotalea litorea]TLU68049.1 amidohydrolase [Thalassotalea litorea]
MSISADAKVTIFTAKKVITMEPASPEAYAIAVSGDKIVGIGDKESLEVWKKNYNAKIDDRFKDKVIMPGLIDPHVHPSLPAVLTQFVFLAPDDWELPTGTFPGAKTPQDYKAMLSKQVEAYFDDANRDPNVPFISWGYHGLWHGDVYRQQLNDWFGDKPVMIWHRSFHEIIGNDAAFKLLGIDESIAKGEKDVDWQKGHFWENGFVKMIPKMTFLLAPDRYKQGMETFVTMMREAGVTSAMDMGVGIFGDPIGEAKLIHTVMDSTKAPARLVLTPIITDFIARGKSPEQALQEVEQWNANNSERVMFDKHFKLMMDGAIYSGLSQYKFPGYIDGHQGQWMAPMEVTYQYAETFWNAGYQLHAHTNGDASADALIDIVRKLQAQGPRFDHRATLEHFAYVTDEQIAQMHELGMTISANPYYQYILSDIYAEQWLGEDRARNMVPLGTARKYGMKVALHSDCPMAPLSPLTLAWAAVNRTTINDNENNQYQALSVDEALRAITIDAAWMMRKESQIGSIRTGKQADFTILEDDPYKVDPMKIKDINIWGVVFSGQVYPNQKQ